jgi:hypothetical protein
MRFLVAVLTAVSIFATTSVPWHRCATAGSDGLGEVVLAGHHAHDGHHEPYGHRHGDDEPCCVDAPSDPTGLPGAAPALPDAIEEATPALAVAEAPDSIGRVALDALAPVPRVPTRNVVLLR